MNEFYLNSEDISLSSSTYSTTNSNSDEYYYTPNLISNENSNHFKNLIDQDNKDNMTSGDNSMNLLIDKYSRNMNANLDDSNNKEIFLNSINFLIYLKEPWKLTNSCVEEVINCLNRLNEIDLKSTCIITFDYLDDSTKSSFIDIIVEYFKYIYENLKESMNKYGGSFVKKDLLNINVTSQTNDFIKRIDIFYKFSLLMWSWADKSFDFCVKFQEAKGIRAIFRFLNDELLIDNIINSIKLYGANKYCCGTNKMYKSCYKLALTIRSMIGSIHNLSRHEQIFKYEWRDMNCFNCLIGLVYKFNQLPKLNIRLLAYFALINLYKKNLNPEFAANLVELSLVLSEVIDLVDKCSKMIATNDEKLKRKSFRVTPFSENLTEITVISSRETEWRLTELINFLINVSSIDNDYKYCIYEKHSLKNSIKLILFNGNLIEKQYGLMMLWKLTLDLRVSRLVRNDFNLYSFLIGLSLNKFVKDKNILKYSNLILFLVDNYDFENLDNIKQKKRSSSFRFYNIDDSNTIRL